MKTGIITGASRGIGNATARLLSEKGYEVVRAYRSAQETSPKIQWIELDLAIEASIERFVAGVGDTTFDFLINNAGILLEDWSNPNIDMAQLLETLQTNLIGTISLTEKLLPKLNRGAAIFNVSSGWGAFSDNAFSEFQPHYKISKAGLNMYTKLLSKRLQAHDIRVAAFDPGWVKTRMGGENANRSAEEVAYELFRLLESDFPTGYFWLDGRPRKW